MTKKLTVDKFLDNCEQALNYVPPVAPMAQRKPIGQLPVAPGVNRGQPRIPGRPT